jgi:uncharacterized membrane protein YraQ (UPF0718 family)
LESLVISILALFAAIPLYELLNKNAGLHRLLDGFIFVAIGGLVIALLLPEAFSIAGWWALPLFCAGFFLPSLSENLLVRSAKPLHFSAIVLSVFAFALHVLADGAALAPGHGHDHHHHHGLELGVILHRLPIGLAIWWYVRPQFGAIPALALLTMVSLGTVAGFIWAPAAMSLLSNESIALFQAFVTGTLMHVVFHSRPEAIDQHAGTTRRWWEGIGNIWGAAFVVFFLSGHAHAEAEIATGWLSQFSDSLFALTLESAPALLLAFVAAAVAATYLPPSYFSWMSIGSNLSQASRGIAVGLPLPVCSCGVVPLYHTLVRKGVPPSAATAFLVATPELGIDAILISLPLLGDTMTLVRVIAAAILALAIGLVMGKLIQSTHAKQEIGEAIASHSERLAKFRHSLIDIVDHTSPWILAGLIIAAALDPLIQYGGFDWIPSGWEIPFFALLGMPVYVCASGATPLVAVLLFGGVSPGAALAFLLTGPATNVTTFGILQNLHGRHIAILFGVLTFFFAVALGYATNAVLPDFEPISLKAEEHALGIVNSVAIFLLGLLLMDSLLRRGARAFLGELNPGSHDHEHDHDDHNHGDHTRGGAHSH